MGDVTMTYGVAHFDFHVLGSTVNYYSITEED